MDVINDNYCSWINDLTIRKNIKILNNAHECDWLVVGAGYTGLTAGIIASDLGAKTIVLDAEEAGKGASTRNGGMFGAHHRTIKTKKP